MTICIKFLFSWRQQMLLNATYPFLPLTYILLRAISNFFLNMSRSFLDKKFFELSQAKRDHINFKF